MEGLTSCASILFRIDKMIDYKQLDKEITDREKECIKELKYWGIGSAKKADYSFVTATPMLIGIMAETDRDILRKVVVKAISESNDFDFCSERFEKYVVEGGLGDLHSVFIDRMFPMCFAGRDVIVDRAETLARLDQEQTVFGKYLNAVFHNFERGYINNYKSSLKSTKDKRIVEDSLIFIKNADSVSSLLDLQELIAPFFPEVSKAACNRATKKCISFTVVNESDAKEVIDRLGYKSSYARRLIWCHLFSIVLFTAFHVGVIWGSVLIFVNSQKALLIFLVAPFFLSSLGLVLQYAIRIIPAIINLFRKQNFNFDRTIFIYTKKSNGYGRYKARNF